MDLGNLHGLMEESMKVNGKMENNMEKEPLLIQKEKWRKEYGKMPVD